MKKTRNYKNSESTFRNVTNKIHNFSRKKTKLAGEKKYLEYETLPDPASGMISGILFSGQIPGAHERDGHRIPKNHLDRGRCHRRQIKGAELPLQWQMHIHVANPGQSIALHGGHRDKISPLSLSARDELQKLFRISRLAKQHQQIPLGENADIAMEGVDRR